MMRSLVAVVLFLVVGAERDYSIDTCICDLKKTEEIKAGLTASASNSRRQRSLLEVDTSAEDKPLGKRRLLFGFELLDGLDQEDTVTKNMVASEINTILTKELTGEYNKTVVAGDIESKILYYYIDLEVDADEAMEKKVFDELKKERETGTPPKWFGQKISTNDGNPSIISDYDKTVLLLGAQLTTSDLSSLNSTQETTKLDNYLTPIFKNLTAPFLKIQTLFGPRNMLRIQMQFPSAVENRVTDVGNALDWKNSPPDGYTLDPSYDLLVALGPADINLPANYATIKLTVKDGTTGSDLQQKIDEAMKGDVTYKWCNFPIFHTSSEATIDILFNKEVTREILDGVKKEIEKLDSIIQEFAEPTQGLDFINNPEFHLTTTITLEEDGLTEDQVTDKANNMLGLLNGIEEIGVGTFTKIATTQDNTIVLDSAFIPLLSVNDLQSVHDAISTSIDADLQVKLTSVLRGPYEINKPENVVKVQFNAAADQDLNDLDQNDFLQKLTTSIHDATDSPADFVWAEPISIKGQEVNVEFHFLDGEGKKPKDALEHVLDKLTDEDTLGALKLDATSNYKVADDGVDSSSDGEHGTNSTDGNNDDGPSSGGNGTNSSGGNNDDGSSSGGNGTDFAGGNNDDGLFSGGDGTNSSSVGNDDGSSGVADNDSLSQEGDNGSSNGDSNSKEDVSVKQPTTTYEGVKVKADDTTEVCTCDVECSIEMKFTLTNFPWKETYSDVSSADFKSAATSFEGPIDNMMKAHETIGPYFVDSFITQISNPEGSVKVSADVQVSEGLACAEANTKVQEVAEKEAKSGSFAGQEVDKTSFSYKKANPSSNGDSQDSTTADPKATTEEPIIYEHHEYFLTVTIPVIVGVLLLIILIMCCMSQNSCCCKIFDTDASESSKLIP